MDETPLGPALAARYAHLRDIARSLGSAAVAFSGGVDSALALKVLHDELGERALAVTAHSPSIPREEREDAARIAREIGARQLVIETEEIELRGYFENSPLRCAACKSELYTKIAAVARREGLAWVADGVNAEDAERGDRPGVAAGERMGVRSPLREAGLRKEEVRALARHLGLSDWAKPAMACLSSRIPFGEPITREKLDQVARAEGALRRLGFVGARVRHHGTVARIEIPAARIEEASRLEVRAAIVAGCREAGFAYVALDLEGYRTGSANEVLPLVRIAARKEPRP
jgi:uncharacterized protein